MKPNAHILVVEDEALSRDMITRRLERRGFGVDAVSDGVACLQWLGLDGDPNAHPPGAMPDLVLLDIQMPNLSGLDVLRRIRSRHGRDALPVILVTALSDADDVVRGLEAGANDYVVKPIAFPILLARVAACLRMKESIRLLVEAERQRVVIAALGEACHQLSQPMQAVIITLESLIRHPATDPTRLAADLTDVLAWTQQVSGVIHRLQEVGTNREVSYTQRMRMLDEGTGDGEGVRPR